MFAVHIDMFNPRTGTSTTRNTGKVFTTQLEAHSEMLYLREYYHQQGFISISGYIYNSMHVLEEHYSDGTFANVAISLDDYGDKDV